MSMTYEECLGSRTIRPTPQIEDNVLRQFEMRHKVCVVTGGSRGIGWAIAEGLAEAGANVVLIFSSDRPEMIEKAAQLAERCGVKVVSRRCDVSSAAEVEAMVTKVMEAFGKIDVFFANAGVCYPKSILDETLEEYHAQMNTNVHGVYYCAKYVGPVFKKQSFGNFIITSSISGQVVTVPLDHTTYNVTKAAVTHLGRSLAREWRDFARVNIVSPGWIDTDMSADQASINEACRMSYLGRQGSVKELKAIFLYLASNASSFVTGANFTIDGGYTSI